MNKNPNSAHVSSEDILQDINRLPEKTRLECENLIKELEIVFTNTSTLSQFYATNYLALKLGENLLKKQK